MGKFFNALNEEHKAFLEKQKVFFVATAPAGRHINLSPKGLDTLRVTGPNQVIWLNLTGSSNETAGHLLEDPRMTIMLCSFDTDPLIMRLFGTARFISCNDSLSNPEWNQYAALFPGYPGKRQIVMLDIEKVQTSCGEAVPLFDFVGDRNGLIEWANNKGENGLLEYRREKNSRTMDDQPTDISP